MKFIKNVSSWDFLKGLFRRHTDRQDYFILSDDFIERTFCDTYDGFVIRKTAIQNFLDACKQHGFDAVFDQSHGWWVVALRIKERGVV